MTDKRAAFAGVFTRYVPQEAVNWCVDRVFEHSIQVKITRSRNSKLGDYRHPFGGKGHRITINHDLNPFTFLVVYAHEVAHLICWVRHRNQVPPHGKEWQTIFSELLRELIALQCFPDEISGYLERRGNTLAASSCADSELYELLRNYDKPNSLVLLKDIPQGGYFKMKGGRVFQKGPRQRTRYKCLEQGVPGLYLIHGTAEVLPVFVSK